jgi:hypothetical protein
MNYKILFSSPYFLEAKNGPKKDKEMRVGAREEFA